MKHKRTHKQLAAIIKKHCAVIAKERDALRELQSEIEDICEPTDEAVALLEQAVEALSQRL